VTTLQRCRSCRRPGNVEQGPVTECEPRFWRHIGCRKVRMKTHAELLADLNATRESDQAARFADLLRRWTK
jgi:hypothetical protein